MAKKRKKTNKRNWTFKHKYITFIASGLVFLFLVYYLALPIFNFRNVGFYIYLSLIAAYILIIVKEVLVYKKKVIGHEDDACDGIKYDYTTGKFYKGKKVISQKYSFINVLGYNLLITFGGLLLVLIIIGLSGAKIFNAKKYYSQLEVSNGTMEEFETVFNYDSGSVKLPILDSDLAFKLAQAKLSQYGAQYTIDYDNFTLISITRDGEEQLVRIAPLEYSNFFVSLNRMNQGTVGYIEVNVITKEAKIVEFEDGLKYMPSAILSKDLDRYIRFNFPSEIVEGKYFEIDDNGNPYWVVPTLKKEIGIAQGPSAKGLIIVDPISGEIKKYKLGEEPEWVDRATHEYIADIQTTNSFKFKNGWFNAVLGQKKEVFQISDGYNYFIKDGKTYYVSCITSPNENDQTSIGFVTINLKNREATFYAIDGITEMRAREIAENDYRVKAQAFTSTWPILIDMNGVPTYFLVLKNEVQAQMIVFIDVETGIKVGMGENIEAAKSDYLKQLDVNINDSKTVSSKVIYIRDLDSRIEFMLEGIDRYFVVDVNEKTANEIRFMQVNDEFELTYSEEANYNLVISMEKIK